MHLCMKNNWWRRELWVKKVENHFSRNFSITNFKIIMLLYNTIIQQKLVLWKIKTAGGNDALTHVTQHFDAGFHIALLTWEQPVAVIHTENSLQQLHKHWLPCLRQREMSHLLMVWRMLYWCTGLLEDTVCYLQTCALVWERWAEEGGDDAHDGLSNVALQNCVSVLTVTRVIAHLQKSMLNV